LDQYNIKCNVTQYFNYNIGFNIISFNIHLVFFKVFSQLESFEIQKRMNL